MPVSLFLSAFYSGFSGAITGLSPPGPAASVSDGWGPGVGFGAAAGAVVGAAGWVTVPGPLSGEPFPEGVVIVSSPGI